MQNNFQNRRKALSPMQAVQAAFEVMCEATYEDSEATDADILHAHQRFENAIKYIASHAVEEQFNDLWAENQALRERITRLEMQLNQMRGIANAQV